MKLIELNNYDTNIVDFDDFDGFDSFEDYYKQIVEDSIYELTFSYDDIDESVFAVDDDYDYIRLNCGRWIRICWDLALCYVEYVDDDKTIDALNKAYCCI